MTTMYCDQCEQTRNGTGCVSEVGVCGKDADMESLQKIILYGLKGMAAYKHHARRLGKVDPEVDAFIEEALFATVTNVNFDMDSLLEMVLDVGKHNLRVMELLDQGHVEAFGQPELREVQEGVQEGPGILVTGHDMVDLRNLLDQAAGTDIKVYTHGEMLPAHMYPELANHPNLAGHYGGAWQKQRMEFEEFGGPILATTNCVLIPGANNTYLDKLYTTRSTAIPGATRITDDDYSALIAKAKEVGPLMPTKLKAAAIGFHHSVVLGLADKITEAVKAGKISHFFFIGGCDGAEPGRNYFSNYAKAAPADSIILTAGCGKYRIRNHDYGTVEGIPRLLDMGQCNDSYGAIQVALGLAKAFNCGVNDLPLTLCVSWFEQKAVAVLLTLLHLGVKNIILGPALPAFVTPNVLNLLVEKYGLRPIGEDATADVNQAVGA